MATVSLFQGFDFRNNDDRFWLVTELATHHVTMVSDQYMQTLDGDFTYSAAGDFTGGTATGTSYFANNVELYRITGMSHDAQTLAMLAGFPGQKQELYAFVFNGNDTIAGSAGKDGLMGYAGDDSIGAGAGDDSLNGGAGNDRLDGQGGIDTAVYSGNRSAYTVTHTASGFTVTDSRGIDGTDTLTGVERLVFGDKTMALDVDAGGIGGKAYRLYQAAFDRTPDAVGVGFWMSAMEKGESLTAVAEGFINSKEYTDAYGTNLSNKDLVTKYYANILHRAPEQGGLDFWTGILDKKAAPLAEVLAGISESQENINGTAVIIGNGFEYKPYG